MSEPPKIDLSSAVYRRQKHILGLAERGMSSAEIRRFAARALRSDFQHPEALDLLSDSVIMTTLARVRSMYARQPWMRPAFAACLAIYRHAERADPKVSVEICEDFASDIRRGEQRSLTTLGDEPPHAGLFPESALQQIYRDIGHRIEEVVQPHLRELLEESFVTKGISDRRGSVARKELGVVVNDLLQARTVPPALLIPGTWGIRINQWRNIAQHADWQLINDSVRCWYGVPPDETEVLLRQDEVTLVSSAVLDVMLVVSAARTVFLFDRPVPLVQLVEESPDRRHSLNPHLEFATAVASFGFELAAYELTTTEAHITVRDVTDQDPTRRRWFVVSFAYHLAQGSKKPKVEVILREKDGTPNLKGCLRLEDCADIKPQEWGRLAERMELEDLKDGKFHTNANL